MMSTKMPNGHDLCIMKGDKTRQGYVRKHTLKPAGYSFYGTTFGRRTAVTTEKRPFEKPATTYTQQVALLQQRGMVISNPSEAEFYLQHLNYYRLGAYWLPFEADHPTHAFKPGTRFDEVLNLYVFDRELRLLLLDAIERVEVSVRGQWAYQMAHSKDKCEPLKALGSHGYLDSALAKNPQHWEKNFDSLKAEVNRSEEEFIQHFLKTYLEKLPPVWAACEVMSFGLLSRWYSNLKPMPIRRSIAAVYGVDEKVLGSRLHHLSLVRNTCAHHSRLWNREFTVTPLLPRSKPALLIGQSVSGSRKLYNTLIILLYWMDVIAPKHHWRGRLKDLITRHAIPVVAMGFPDGWNELDIWQEQT